MLYPPMVVPEEGKLPDDLFENAAAGREVRVRVFTDRVEGLAWPPRRG